jgi:hypothetical protein
MEWKWFFLGVVVAITGIAFFNFINSSNEENDKAVSREIAALVNGAPVYADSVIVSENITFDEALKSIIENTVLLQQAEREGIVVTGNEVERAFKDYLAAANISEEELSTVLKEKNSSLNSFISSLHSDLVVKKLISAHIPSNFVIKFEEVEALYNESYRGSNVSFDAIESKLINELIEKRKEEAKRNYIDSLLSRSEIVVFGEQ